MRGDNSMVAGWYYVPCATGAISVNDELGPRAINVSQPLHTG
jgi:hypothetical protein